MTVVVCDKASQHQFESACRYVYNIGLPFYKLNDTNIDQAPAGWVHELIKVWSYKNRVDNVNLYIVK